MLQASLNAGGLKALRFARVPRIGGRVRGGRGRKLQCDSNHPPLMVNTLSFTSKEMILSEGVKS